MSISEFKNLRGVAVVLIVIGIAISGYLTQAHFADKEVICSGEAGFDCDRVQSSVYSELFGVPVALLGLLTNVGLLGLVLVEERISLLQEYGVTLFFGIVFFGTLYSIYLIYIQAVQLEAFCQWCLGHEVVYFALMGIAGVRLWGVFAEDTIAEKSKSRKKGRK